MIYFLRFQQQKLAKYAGQVAEKKAKAPTSILTDDVRQSLMNVNNAYQMFTYQTKKPLGKFLSYVPFSYCFRLRMICSDRINTAYKTLHNTEKRLNQLKPKPLPIGIIQVNPIHRTVSDPLPLPKVYPSPLASPRNSFNINDDAPLFKYNIRLVSS